jgi:hypothetical protein
VEHEKQMAEFFKERDTLMGQNTPPPSDEQVAALVVEARQEILPANIVAELANALESLSRDRDKWSRMFEDRESFIEDLRADIARRDAKLAVAEQALADHGIILS